MDFTNYHANLRMNGRCPVCDATYDGKFTVLGERDQRVLTYARCSACGSGLLSMLSIEPSGLHAIGLITDLGVNEVARYERGYPVSNDDLLQLHALLGEDQPLTNLINDQTDSKE